MDTETLALRIAVKPIARECWRCLIGGSTLCVLCASLVRDESGTRYVCLRPFEGGRWRKVAMTDLIDAPYQLQSEGPERTTGKGVKPETLQAQRE